MQRTKRALLYCRVSTGDQNMAGQEAEMRAYARARGWTVSKVLQRYRFRRSKLPAPHCTS